MRVGDKGLLTNKNAGDLRGKPLEKEAGNKKTLYLYIPINCLLKYPAILSVDIPINKEHLQSTAYRSQRNFAGS